jgi:hypothetical protein
MRQKALKIIHTPPCIKLHAAENVSSPQGYVHTRCRQQVMLDVAAQGLYAMRSSEYSRKHINSAVSSEVLLALANDIIQ